MDRLAGINHCNAFGRTLLHFAVAEWRSADEIMELLAKGAEVNVADQDGYTPLHEAAICRDVTIVRPLLEAGANPSAQVRWGAHQGMTALRLALLGYDHRASEPILAADDPRAGPIMTLLRPVSPPLVGEDRISRRYGDWWDKQLVGRDEIDTVISKYPYFARGDYRLRYTQLCVCTEKSSTGEIYRGTGIAPADHPARGHRVFNVERACLHCHSEHVLVIDAGYSVSIADGDLGWEVEVYCQNCGWYSGWSYQDV